MAEVTLRWPTVRSNPIHPEHEERTYSSSVEASRAILEMDHDVFIGNMLVTKEMAQAHLDVWEPLEAAMQAKAQLVAELANYGNDGYDRAASGRWAAWMDAAKAVEAGEDPAALRARMVAAAGRHDGIAKGYAMDAYNPFDHGFARGAEDVVKALDEAGVAA